MLVAITICFLVTDRDPHRTVALERLYQTQHFRILGPLVEVHQYVLTLHRPEVQHGVDAAQEGDRVGLEVTPCLTLILREYIDEDRLVIHPKQFVQVFGTRWEYLLRTGFTHSARTA